MNIVFIHHGWFAEAIARGNWQHTTQASRQKISRRDNLASSAYAWLSGKKKPLTEGIYHLFELCVTLKLIVVSFNTSIKVYSPSSLTCNWESFVFPFPVFRHHVAFFRKQGWCDHRKVRSSCHRPRRDLSHGRGRSRSLWCNLLLSLTI